MYGHGISPAHGYEALSLGTGPVLRATIGSVLYLTLIALLGIGIAAMVRDSAVSIGAVLGLLYLFPIVTSFIGDPTWQRHPDQISPMTAGLYVQATTNLRSLPLTPWQGVGVLRPGPRAHCWRAAWSSAGAVPDRRLGQLTLGGESDRVEQA